MKLTLVVLAAGKLEGKKIPVTVHEFIIGRDPDCHLRPGSATISQKHCALMIVGEKVFVRDFDTLNGTAINGRQIKGQIQLINGDRLKLGPLEFAVQIEPTLAAVNQPTPLPPTKIAPASTDDDDDNAAAALLLCLDQPGVPPPGSPGVDEHGIPMGSTIMDALPPVTQPGGTEGPKDPEAEAGKPPAAKTPAKAGAGNTSSAAKNILDKYLRRSR